MKRITRSLACVSLAVLLVVTTSALAGPAEPSKGGVLSVANVGEPASMDPMWSTHVPGRIIQMHIFEPLFTYDARYNIVPMLAEKYSVSSDSKRYEIKIRTGLKFHDGGMMTSADVVSSLRRWMQLSGSGRVVAPDVAEIRATDNETVVITFKTPTGLLLTFLADPAQMAAVLPRAIADQAGRTQLKEDQLIGTGPYRFVEWRHDQYIRLRRFDQYAGRREEPSGYAGRKLANFDEIMFHAIPDSTVRMAGLKSGQYHVALELSPDDITVIQADRNLQPAINKLAPLHIAPYFNKKKGPFTNVLLRRAVAAALNMEPLLRASAKRPEFYALNGSMYPQGNRWFTTAGLQDHYNVNNPDLARRLMKEAGYDGAPIKMLVQTDLLPDYQYILTVMQQMRAVGFKLDPTYTDYPTVTTLRGKGDHDMWFTGAVTFRADPALQIGFNCNWPSTGMGWCDNDFLALMKEFRETADFGRRFRLWTRLHEMLWDRVPFVKIGDTYRLNGVRADVRGYTPMAEDIFWNAWLVR